MQDFQAFTIKFSGITNVLCCNVGVSAAFDIKAITENKPDILEALSIWDTGATCTVISKDFATKLGLVPTGKTKITGVNHTTEENTYIVNVYLPNKVCVGFVKIAEVPAISNNAGILIGMDIIAAGDFSVFTENKKTVMTYRLPSIGGVDYVQEAGNIRNKRAILQKFDEQKKHRKTLSPKNRKKGKQEKKNKKNKHNKKKK